jgi:hypothetical protein
MANIYPAYANISKHLAANGQPSDNSDCRVYVINLLATIQRRKGWNAKLAELQGIVEGDLHNFGRDPEEVARIYGESVAWIKSL